MGGYRLATRWPEGGLRVALGALCAKAPVSDPAGLKPLRHAASQIGVLAARGKALPQDGPRSILAVTTSPLTARWRRIGSTESPLNRHNAAITTKVLRNDTHRSLFCLA